MHLQRYAYIFLVWFERVPYIGRFILSLFSLFIGTLYNNLLFILLSFISLSCILCDAIVLFVPFVWFGVQFTFSNYYVAFGRKPYRILQETRKTKITIFLLIQYTLVSTWTSVSSLYTGNSLKSFIILVTFIHFYDLHRRFPFNERFAALPSRPHSAESHFILLGFVCQVKCRFLVYFQSFYMRMQKLNHCKCIIFGFL